MKTSLETSNHLMAAIEAITGGNLDCNGNCGNPGCDGSHPETCNDPAVELWRDGGMDDEIRAWLDVNRPGWRDESPLFWGAGTFE